MNIGVIILAVAILTIPAAILFDKWNDRDFREMERQIKETENKLATLARPMDKN